MTEARQQKKKAAQNTIDSDRDWMTKTEAATLLGVSVRQLEKRETQGFIRKMTLPRAKHERTAPVRYSRADIEAFKAGDRSRGDETEAEPLRTKNGHETANGAGKAVARVAPAGDALALLAAALARIAPAAPATMPGPFVGLGDAVELSGMPASWLLAQARAGVPWAVNIGTGKKAFWRFAISKDVK